MSPRRIGELLAVGGVVASVLALLRRLIHGRAGVTIPVAIDAVREIEGVPLARSTYFVATDLPPTSVWRRLRGSPAFFSLDGLLILAESIDDADRMRDVLDRIEDVAEAFSIELDDLWIPVAWLERAGEPTRGAVFRVSADLFELAYRHRAGSLPTSELLLHTGTALATIEAAPRETAAYEAWARRQIDDARAALEAHPERRLGWADPDAPAAPTTPPAPTDGSPSGGAV